MATSALSVHALELTQAELAEERLPGTLKRRFTRQEGRALEILAHAAEYLVDSRAITGEMRDVSAIELLAGANREVFMGAEIVVPRWVRLRRKMKLIVSPSY